MNNMFEEWKRRRREMDRLFGAFLRGPRMWRWPEEKALMKFEAPATDISETDKEVIARFDLPGVEKKDIQLMVTEDSIKVKAEKKHEVEEKKEGFYRQERSYEGFYRESSLPAKVKADKAKAEFKNGVLMVSMPKMEVKKIKKKGKTIEIK